MAQQGIPGLYIDTSATADSLSNSRRLSTWGRTVSPRMFGVGDALVGQLPEPSTPQDGYLMQAGLVELSFSAGAATWTFPFPFPNGVLFMTGSLAGQGAALSQTVAFGATSLTATTVYLSISGSAYSGNAFLLLQAIGW